MDKLNYIKGLIPEKFYNEINKIKDSHRKHPLIEIIFAIEHPELTPMIQYYANYTIDSIINISKTYENWFYKKWNEHVISSLKPDFNHAVGALAEIRVLNILNNSNIKVETVKEKNGKNKEYTPDFKIILENGNGVYVEVFCPLIREKAANKIKEFNKKEDNLDDNLYKKRSIQISTVMYDPICEGVTSKDEVINKIGQRILGAKARGNQAIKNHCNILWIDLISPEWGCMSKTDTLPFTSGRFKDFYNTSTSGIWQCLYGKKGMKIFNDRVYLKYANETDFKLQTIEGHFKFGSKWSGIIMSFIDGVVFLQNPWTENHVSKGLLKKIVRIDNFDFVCSWIDINPENLECKIENKIRDIENIYDMVKGY